MIIRYNIQKLEEMISDFYNITQIQIEVLDSELNPITKPVTSPHSFCQRIFACEGGAHKCIQSDTAILEECVKNKQPIVHLCHAGLFDIATPIVHAQENIIMGLYAKRQGVEKIIAKVNEDSRAQMVEGLGIDSIVSAKTATADAIFSYVRARQNSLSSTNIESMYRLVDDRVEALEFLVKEETSYTNIALKDLKLKTNNLIACIGRKRQMIIPSGSDSIQVGDTVVVVTKSKKVQDITDILG